MNKYNNIYHSAIKIKPDGLKPNTCIDYGKEINNESPKFKNGDIARISECKSFFCKRLHSNLVRRIFFFFYHHNNVHRLTSYKYIKNKSK